MPAGFAAPDVLFGGNSAAPERRFYRQVLEGLKARGYERFVEVCCGAFAGSLIAVDVGFKPSQIEASDVTLYSSIVGTMLTRGDLNTLGATLDGEPILLPDADPVTQAAFLLWVQLRARMEARPDAEYWRNIVTDLAQRAEHHQAGIRKQLSSLQARVGGLSYRPLDLFEHITEVAGDPKTVILAAPPSYTKGFERFYDTGGRLEWAEPTYDIFEPEVSFDRLAKLMDGLPAMLLCLQETLPGTNSYPRPVFATPIGMGRYAYVITNHVDEVLAITGGPKVVPRRPGEITPSQYPPLPPDYDITPESKVDLLPVKATIADYYRDVWLHRLTAQPGAYNVLVVIDGYVAAVIGYSIDPMARPYNMKSKWIRHILLRYGVGAPHITLRTGRLATMLALQHKTAELCLGTAGAIYLAASQGLMTVNMTRHPEAKEMRGLMKKVDKQPHPDGFKLTYVADWQNKPDAEVLADFLTKEATWRKASKNSK